ncbi:MAG TPA: uL15 family ribosomal protein [Candidatus Paceibacterota bacterium]|nr:uL15 family ribosomal protein [Candidatus Paceibacterota bacterium]
MQLHQLKPKTPRAYGKRVGRGGKKGTYAGKGTKGQKSRAGAGVKPGFRGGDNRLWQLFPKQRGASKKPGSNRPHRKHRYYQLRHAKPAAVNLDVFNRFDDKTRVTPEMLVEAGIILNARAGVKVLGGGTLKKKVLFEGFAFSASAKDAILKAGGTIA